MIIERLAASAAAFISMHVMCWTSGGFSVCCFYVFVLCVICEPLRCGYVCVLSVTYM